MYEVCSYLVNAQHHHIHQQCTQVGWVLPVGSQPSAESLQPQGMHAEKSVVATSQMPDKKQQDMLGTVGDVLAGDGAG